MKTTLNVLSCIFFFSVILALGFMLGIAAEQKKPKPPPEPLIHHHLYYLDRTECKKPV